MQSDTGSKVTGGFFALRLSLGILFWTIAQAASGSDRLRIIVDGSERGTNTQIVRSIATIIAKPAGIELDVRHSAGAPDTLIRLRDGRGHQFAILQADAAGAFLAAAARGSIEASELIAPIRVIAPLSEDDIYFVVRSDSDLNFVHDIGKARINLGVLNGNTAMTVATIYRLMFENPIPEQQTTFLSQQEALVKLTEKTLDVVALVASNPARLLADMKPEARRFVKLLKFDSKHPASEKLLKFYSAKTIPATNYPHLLDDELSILSVKIYLVSHGRNDSLQSRFANSWCQHLPRLRDQGHPALRGLTMGLPQLVSGWLYSRPFEDKLGACMEDKQLPPCTQEDRALGLCG
jgi:TRAP-type uncharacterized transport system substrate-binding protein